MITIKGKNFTADAFARGSKEQAIQKKKLFDGTTNFISRDGVYKNLGIMEYLCEVDERDVLVSGCPIKCGNFDSSKIHLFKLIKL
jgi:hypothetical protein